MTIVIDTLSKGLCNCQHLLTTPKYGDQPDPFPPPQTTLEKAITRHSPSLIYCMNDVNSQRLMFHTTDVTHMHYQLCYRPVRRGFDRTPHFCSLKLILSLNIKY